MFNSVGSVGWVPIQGAPPARASRSVSLSGILLGYVRAVGVVPNIAGGRSALVVHYNSVSVPAKVSLAPLEVYSARFQRHRTGCWQDWSLDLAFFSASKDWAGPPFRADSLEERFIHLPQQAFNGVLP